MYRIDGISPLGEPWRENEDDDYETACRRCETNITLDAALHARIVAALHDDLRSNGSHGRSLNANIPPLLFARDRLEPSSNLPNVAKFEDITTFPFDVTFWTVENEFLTRHRNPLFDPALGITICRSLTVDSLHCFYLGVMLAFVKHVIWWMITEGVWGTRSTIDETIEIAALVVRADLAFFSGKYHADHPNRETD